MAVTNILLRALPLAALFAATIACAQEAPDALVKGVSQEVLAIARSDPKVQAGDQARIHEVVDAKLAPHFDFTHMTALAMGRLSLDVAAKRARVGDKVVELSVREWAVLEFLLQHPSRVVSKQQIIDAILPWGDDLSLNAVEVYISRLRLKIADGGVTIRTIRGFGYMLEPGA